MKARLQLVRIRLDQLTGDYLLTCAVCGKLGPMRHYWQAARMARDHEAIHDEPDSAD